MPNPKKSLPEVKEPPHPRRWLRLRPSKTDGPAEFLRDFTHWSMRVIDQDGFNWAELEYFLERAVRLSAKKAS